MEEIFSGQNQMEQDVRQSFMKTVAARGGQDGPATLYGDWLESPVGELLAAGDGEHLHLLSFVEKGVMERKAAMILRKLKAHMVMDRNPTIRSVAGELEAYFSGKREPFETPVKLIGTVFQVRVWEELRKVAYGTTISYTELARKIDKPAAFRAVAQACAQNPVAIVVPCHRVINDGGGGGYTAGWERKRWLVDFEKRVMAGDLQSEG